MIVSVTDGGWWGTVVASIAGVIQCNTYTHANNFQKLGNQLHVSVVEYIYIYISIYNWKNTLKDPSTKLDVLTFWIKF